MFWQSRHVDCGSCHWQSQTCNRRPANQRHLMQPLQSAASLQSLQCPQNHDITKGYCCCVDRLAWWKRFTRIILVTQLGFLQTKWHVNLPPWSFKGRRKTLIECHDGGPCWCCRASVQNHVDCCHSSSLVLQLCEYGFQKKTKNPTEVI